MPPDRHYHNAGEVIRRCNPNHLREKPRSSGKNLITNGLMARLWNYEAVFHVPTKDTKSRK